MSGLKRFWIGGSGALLPLLITLIGADLAVMIDQHDQLTPGVAERWEVRNDGATFWLRDDAYWSDGQPVTAHDFVFAWRHAVDPETASQYAFILYPVLNAEAINNGELEALPAASSA